jgi:hypothetical protein
MKILSEFEQQSLSTAKINIDDLTPCRDEVRGSIWFSLETDTSRVNLSFIGTMEAIRRLYSDCISHNKIMLFGLN